jgi:hypothetical protein
VLKKTITYTDFSGEKVTEDFFFHLSKAELIEIQMNYPEGGIGEAMQRALESNDTKKIFKEFKDLVLMSYGKKSLDGKRFVKTATNREEFESSEAYSELMMSFFVNADSAIDFFNGILPEGFVEQMAELGATENTQAQIHELVPKAEPMRMTMTEVGLYQNKQELTDKIVAGEIVIVDD